MDFPWWMTVKWEVLAFFSGSFISSTWICLEHRKPKWKASPPTSWVQVTRSSDALGKWRDVDAAGAVDRRGREVFGHILTERTQKPGLGWEVEVELHRKIPTCLVFVWYLGVSKNRGTPKLSILLGFSLKNNPFWDTTIFGNSYLAMSQQHWVPRIRDVPTVHLWSTRSVRNQTTSRWGALLRRGTLEWWDVQEGHPKLQEKMMQRTHDSLINLCVVPVESSLSLLSL